MKKLNDAVLKLLAKTAYLNAEKEVQSACLFIGYQPKMPQKVKELKKRKQYLLMERVLESVLFRMKLKKVINVDEEDVYRFGLECQ